MLTTITPYWNRPTQLLAWVRRVKVATTPDLHHFVYFVGEKPPEWWDREVPPNMTALCRNEEPNLSIGHYHNLGAEQANTVWIMKLDVDALPHSGFFAALQKKLMSAGPREGFNVGMVHINAVWSETNLGPSQIVDRDTYHHLMRNLHACSSSSYRYPAASNFVCRRDVYLSLGGCDSRFRGYGWEDYQQLFMLEKYQRQCNPLPGPITLANVTRRCRDEISRPKALALWRSDAELCLLHRHHRGSSDPVYRSSMDNNRNVLHHYITANL